ncbi:DNA replication complex GINS protein PSF1 [Porphyridium purpureum]|uniref:DNA replication complex GINS protein PSF1 n=1 Tax=Porphyridium purpureum TaxID=35688 RepID=A0A5J4Z973_PORPP|nr:DNA replication complex GINS protein PSF1 [Porphyridium purpureum]|eukprot:POR5580..scf295_1
MHGQRAFELVQQLRMSVGLPGYDEAGLKEVASEMRDLHGVLVESMQQMQRRVQHGEALDEAQVRAIQCSTVVHLRSVQRNKRCALAYLVNRARRIQMQRWELGATAAARSDSCMSAQEADFLRKYSDILGEYCDAVQLDVTAEIQPPSDLLIEVRVQEDLGTVQTEDGAMHLRRGTSLYVKRGDVEHLIRQGSLEQVQN